MKLHPILPTLLVLLCYTHVATAQETESPAMQESEKVIIAWLQQNAIPIHHTEAGNGFADLQPLKKMLNNVRIVGLGEATHGTREFFQIKHRLLEFLASEMNFNAFALEASYAACQPINNYVLYGKGDRATVLSGQGYIAWDTEEFSKMLDWLRTYNQSVPDEKKIRFYGVDLWNNGLGRRVVSDYLHKQAPDRGSTTDSLFQVLAKVEAKWPMLMDEEDGKTLEKVLPQLQDLINHLAENKDKYVNGSTLIEFDQVLQYTQVMKQWIMANIAGKNSERSKYMAENLRHIVDRERPNAKIIIWEHNEHISGKGKESRSVGDSLINPYLGYYLRKTYADRYYAFGFDFNQGFYRSRALQPGQAPGDLKEGKLPPASVGSLAWYLSRTNIGNMMLDLRTPPGNPVVEQWLKTPQIVHQADWGYQNPSEVYTEVNIKKHYDGIIFFDKITATRPTTNALEAVSKGERF
ncbi:erythromycin esterase family protein [candidate division KSB1 bacterium]|nr:erythromycin esterase family protein [candidate division KSB1 bacterium]